MLSPSEHWDRVKALAWKLHADGCTGVPDLWFRLCCYEHDDRYRTGKTPEGETCTRAQADWALHKCMQQASPFGLLSPLAWVYWIGVRCLGRSSWKGQ